MLINCLFTDKNKCLQLSPLKLYGLITLSAIKMDWHIRAQKHYLILVVCI